MYLALFFLGLCCEKQIVSESKVACEPRIKAMRNRLRGITHFGSKHENKAEIEAEFSDKLEKVDCCEKHKNSLSSIQTSKIYDLVG